MREFSTSVPSVRLDLPLLVAVIAAGALLTRCSSTDVAGLVDNGDPGEVCVPASVDRLATVGLDVLANTAGEQIVITDVGLVDSLGLGLVDWYVAESKDSQRVTSGFYRTSSARTTVGPGEELTLVLGLELAEDAARGSAQAADVSYVVGSSESKRSVQTHIALAVVPGGDVC